MTQRKKSDDEGNKPARNFADIANKAEEIAIPEIVIFKIGAVVNTLILSSYIFAKWQDTALMNSIIDVFPVSNKQSKQIENISMEFMHLAIQF